MREDAIKEAGKMKDGVTQKIMELSTDAQKHMKAVHDNSILGNILDLPGKGAEVFGHVAGNIGNAIVNIDKDSFGRVAKGRPFKINYNRAEYFDKIHTHYNEVPEGERICLFGTNGLLEIAINKGSCASLLGIKTGHLILVEFG